MTICTSCTCDSRMPADVISTNSARVRQLVDRRAAAVAHRRAQAAHQLVDHRRQRALVRNAAFDALRARASRARPRLRHPGNSGRSCPAASRRASPCRDSSCTSGPDRAPISPGDFLGTGEQAAEHHRTTRRRPVPWRCRPNSGCRRRRSPECRRARTPPSANWIAEICGTPTPATMRVVQIEPGPMPTFTASAPWSASALRAVGRRDVAADDLHLRIALA
mgnify:CR=1 FL=1